MAYPSDHARDMVGIIYKDDLQPLLQKSFYLKKTKNKKKKHRDLHLREEFPLRSSEISEDKSKTIFSNLSKKSLRGESKKFVDFVNKIKSICAISLKLPYVCDQFNTNKHRKFQTNRLINIVSMASCLMRVSATRSTPRR